MMLSDIQQLFPQIWKRRRKRMRRGKEKRKEDEGEKD